MWCHSSREIKKKYKNEENYKNEEAIFNKFTNSTDKEAAKLLETLTTAKEIKEKKDVHTSLTGSNGEITTQKELEVLNNTKYEEFKKEYASQKESKKEQLVDNYLKLGSESESNKNTIPLSQRYSNNKIFNHGNDKILSFEHDNGDKITGYYRIKFTRKDNLDRNNIIFEAGHSILVPTNNEEEFCKRVTEIRGGNYKNIKYYTINKEKENSDPINKADIEAYAKENKYFNLTEKGAKTSFLEKKIIEEIFNNNQKLNDANVKELGMKATLVEINNIKSDIDNEEEDGKTSHNDDSSTDDEESESPKSEINKIDSYNKPKNSKRENYYS